MKKYTRFLLVLFALLVYSVVPVFAEETGATQYVPIIPKFLSLGNGVAVNVPLNTNNAEVNNFMKDFYNKPYLIVLRQETDTDYFPRNRNLKSSVFVGDDKRWSIHFLKPKFNYLDYNFEFTYFNPIHYDTSTSYPMQVRLTNNNQFEDLEYNFDFQNNKFYQPILRNSVSAMGFSYVIDSSTLSKPVTTYPNYSCLGGKDFKVYTYDLGKSCHYDWWIGKKRITSDDEIGVIKPQPKADDTSSDDTSSGGTSSGGGSGGYPRPDVGGDGDISNDGEVSNPHNITVKFYYIDEKGNKKPFLYGNYGYEFKTDGASLNFGCHEFNGYVPEHNLYKWKIKNDRVVEIIFHKKGTSSGGGSGGTSSGGGSGGTSSGGGSGGTSSGGGSGDTSHNDSIYKPLTPFNPFDFHNIFKPLHENPWDIFNLFEGIPQPKPLEFPKSIVVPHATEPIINIPYVTEPTINIPDFKEPTINIPHVTEPTMNIPIVDDPFKNWGNYSVDDPLSNINIPVVDDPFKNWGKWE